MRNLEVSVIGSLAAIASLLLGIVFDWDLSLVLIVTLLIAIYAVLILVGNRILNAVTKQSGTGAA